MRWARGKPDGGPPAGPFARLGRWLRGWIPASDGADKPLGQRGEDAAARYLKRQGYRILERNRVLGRNEIDIIALEGDTIAFVEVRTRKSKSGVLPEDTVGPAKQRQIRRAAKRYIDRYGRNPVLPLRYCGHNHARRRRAGNYAVPGCFPG